MTTIRMKAGIGASGLMALAALLLPAGLTAQSGGWQPFLGCWEPDAEEAEGTLCFVPVGNQVEMLTVVDEEVEFRELFSADGTVRTVNQEGCQGTESARFSEDQDRIFTFSNLTCEDGARNSAGIISMVGPNDWVDVRTIDGEDGPMAWVQAYRRVDADVLTDLGFENPDQRMTLRSRAVTSYGALSVDDVLEASEAVGEDALEAWLAETGLGIHRLNADELIALDDAGVSGDLIDVLVAVSYPEHFAVGGGDYYDDRGYYGRRAPRPIWLGYDPFYPGYRYSSFYGFGYGYGYGYGYPYLGARYRPVTVVVDRIGNRGGRVIAGQGYRRSGDRTPRGTASPAPGRRIRNSPSAGTRSGGASIGSRGSTRSPASGRSSGRKAKRRGGG